MTLELVRDEVAIVISSADSREVERAIHQAVIELRDAEAAESRASEIAGRRRLELGRLLVEARKAWPERGPRAKGWGEMLARIGIEDSTAWRYMQLAGYVSCSEQETPDEVPTYAEAGIDKRHRSAVDDGRADDRRDPPPAPRAEPKPDRDSWCTPKWLADAVGRFDLDPCTNERSHIKSKYSYDLARGEDGLELAHETPAKYRVWINPPFSDVMPWVEAYKHTRFCFLVRLDTSTKWFDILDSKTAAWAIPRRDRIPAGESPRIEFEPPPGVDASSPDQNHVLMYAREDDITAAVRKMCRIYRRIA